MKGYSDSPAVIHLVLSSYKNFAILDIPQLFLKQKLISEPSPLAPCTDTTQAQSDNFCDSRRTVSETFKSIFLF